jgi:hypothetical protein|tara:strand:+ start:195 stop:815 length:621 start_codon:yes stop_codon:yes gene_type:complete
MAIPVRYRKSAEVLANYDFADLLTGVGTITLYGISDEAGTKKLSRQALESTAVKADIQGTSGSIESNYDIEFNRSELVKGDLSATITIQATSTTGSSTNDTTVEIFHVDSASSETTIGSQQAITQLSNPSAGSTEYRTTLTFAVNKRFARGDKLRIEVISTVASANSNSVASHYHDGANRNLSLTDQHGIAAPSNLIALIPFDIDI